MSILRFLWFPKQSSICSFEKVRYNQNKLIIQLKYDSRNINLKDINKKFILVERKSKDRLVFKVEEEKTLNKENILNVQINMEYHKSMLTKGVWDAYLQIENGTDTKKIRIINKITDSDNNIPFYIEDLNKYLEIYSTIKGNLSFRSTTSMAKISTELITLDNEGHLKITGYLLVPSWIVENAHDVKKKLVIRSDNGISETEIPIKHSQLRTDLNELYGDSGINYDWTGFDIELDLQNESYGITDGISTDLFINMEYNGKRVTVPLTIMNSIVTNSNLSIETTEGLKQINITKDEESNRVSLLITKEDGQAEIAAVYSEKGEITFEGRIISIKPIKSLESTDYFILLKKRHTDEEYKFDIKLNGSKFSCKIDLNDLIEKSIFTEGIWDLYLRNGNSEYRLVTRLDGINNKQKLISIPQQLLENPKGRAIVIKPYYTLHDELSILVRDYITVKSVVAVGMNQKEMFIKGKLNIQPPNNDLPKSLTGKLSFKGEYGKEYNLPVIWNIEKTGKLEFHFTAEINHCSMEKNKISEEILKNIDFDLIQCEIILLNNSAKFTMNVDPSKVIVNLEDRLKQNNKFKVFYDKNRLKFYKIVNKILPISSKIVVFQSFHGKSYSCNPKAIYEELLSKNRDIKAVWVMNNLNKEIKGAPILVKPHSLKYYYYMARAKYFISNGNFPDFYEKRTGAINLQTWHGTPLKKLGFDIDPNSPSYAENTSMELIKRNERWDYLIAPNNYTSDIMRRAFNFNKQMLNIGYPRNDILYTGNVDEKTEEIKKRLNISQNKKVILYAPTWRDYDFHRINTQEPYEFKFDLEKFREKFGEEYVLLVRLHYRDAARIKISEFEDFVYNVSSFDDIQELYLISDLLITDYSSVMFDYANLNRPMIFYAYDLSRYGSEVRGFYINFQKNAPGPIVLNEDQLFHEIENIDKLTDRYSKRYHLFREKFCYLEDGKAAERTINSVFKIK